MTDAVANALSAFAKDHPLISLLILGMGAMSYIDFAFGRFVTFTHKMRLHWRRLRSEPDPHLVNN